MYLAAQRVRDSFHREGINAFRYAHGYTWQLPPPGIPDEDSGVLVNEMITIQPAGNVVRSYLDIIAPDEAFWPEIRPAFMAFVGFGCSRVEIQAAAERPPGISIGCAIAAA